MQVIYERARGIDVHKKTIVVCVLLTHDDGTVQRSIRTFSTMTADLLACVDWLESFQIQIVAMESTGVYWRPIFNVLEVRCPAEKRTSKTVSGLLTCCVMAYSKPVSFHHNPSAICATSPVIARR